MDLSKLNVHDYIIRTGPDQWKLMKSLGSDTHDPNRVIFMVALPDAVGGRDIEVHISGLVAEDGSHQIWYFEGYIEEGSLLIHARATHIGGLYYLRTRSGHVTVLD